MAFHSIRGVTTNNKIKHIEIKISIGTVPSLQASLPILKPIVRAPLIAASNDAILLLPFDRKFSAPKATVPLQL